MEIQQRIAGTFDTPGGRAERAAAIQATIAPMQAQIDKWETQKQLAEEKGNKKRAQMLADAIYVKTNDIQEKQAEALELIRQNTAKIEKNTGNLSFEFQSQRFTDMVGLGIGA